ncbi:hypothetical protein ACTXJO_04540 [Psychrobacter celer]|uniref:hypothetical protein n=1 Tax=Psychrobacter celer TaxID=306572 RepID=UPI003FD1D102
MSKRTERITYNLADRGRKHVGVDRSDMNIQSMIERINAPDVQELVASGDLYGYYGHEVRARFGMNPPDVWLNPKTGENIRIEPALRTIELSADSDGNVTSRHEFLDTDTGKYSERLYTNKAGGFSSAVMRKRGASGKFDVTGFYGFDYVRQPNYNTNRGNGMFDSLFWLDEEEAEMAFDSLANLTPQQASHKAALEAAILHQYDSIATANEADLMIGHYQNELMRSQDEQVSRQEKLERLRQRRHERKLEVFDSLICPSVPFDEAVAQWDSFNTQGTSDEDLKTTGDTKKAKADQERRHRERTRIFKGR